MLNVKSFPNKTAVGTFSPFDQVIRLDGFTTKTIEDSFSGEPTVRWKNLLPMFRTLFHEYTHFLDMTTTTYGLSLLVEIFTGATAFSDGKDSMYDNGASRTRRAITDLERDEMHARVLGSYRKTWGYKEWYANAKSQKEDTARLLTGTIFLNPETKKQFAWAPYSIPSIMESNALANEIFFCQAYFKSEIPEEQHRHTLMQGISKEILDLIYNEQYCIYSVCFHRCANQTKEKNIIDASRMSALICELCLDAAPLTLANISPPEKTLALIRPDLRGRVIDEIRSGSRTILFFLLTLILTHSKNGIKNHIELKKELAEQAGLKNFAKETTEAKSGLIKLLEKKRNKNPQYENFLTLIKKNLLIKKKIPLYNFYDYHLPAVLLNDLTVFDLNRFFHPDRAADLFNPAEHAIWMAEFNAWL